MYITYCGSQWKVHLFQVHWIVMWEGQHFPSQVQLLKKKKAFLINMICTTPNKTAHMIFLKGFQGKKFRVWSRMKLCMRMFTLRFYGFIFWRELTDFRGGMRALKVVIIVNQISSSFVRIYSNTKYSASLLNSNKVTDPTRFHEPILCLWILEKLLQERWSLFKKIEMLQLSLFTVPHFSIALR